MAKIRWTNEKYRIALLGDALPGLRSIVDGFMPSDGYDLRYIDSWPASKKRRIQRWYERVHLLEAQERRIVRPRSKQNLKKLIDAFHGDVPSKGFKVAFVPYVDPIGLPGAKKKKPAIRFLKSGIAVDTGAYRRMFIPFDKEALVMDTDSEMQRVFDEMPDAEVFYIQTGEFQTLNATYPEAITRKVKQWMQQYDGVSPLPRGSGNSSDDPASHHYKYWLNGVVGFEFNKRIDPHEMAKQVYKGMQAHKEKRAAQDRKMTSIKGIKKAEEIKRAKRKPVSYKKQVLKQYPNAVASIRKSQWVVMAGRKIIGRGGSASAAWKAAFTS